MTWSETLGRKRTTAVSSRTGWLRRRRVQSRIIKIICYLLLGSGSVLFLLPLLWMLSSSLKTPGQIFKFPPQWIPNPIMWSNYKEALTYLPFGRFFTNTFIIVVLSIMGLLISCPLAAYAFARLRAPGRDFIFLLLLSTMMLPWHVRVIPIYAMWRRLHMINTLQPLIIPSWLAPAFSTFLMRQFFMNIPLELDDAARIDGCGFFSTYWRIMLPLSKPAVATITIFHFMGKWNEFISPLLYLNDINKYTVALGLSLFSTDHGIKWNLLMAATLVFVLPSVVLFFLAQEHFIQGIVITGVKG